MNLWPIKPFRTKQTAIRRHLNLGREVSAAHAIAHFEQAVPMGREPTIAEVESMVRAIPGFDYTEPDWESVRAFLTAKRINVDPEMTIDELLGVVGFLHGDDTGSADSRVKAAFRQRAVLKHKANVDPKELAEEFGVSVSTIYRWFDKEGYRPDKRD